MNKFEQVEKFNKEILGISVRVPSLQKEEEYLLSHHQMREETDEFLVACEQEDYIGALDALIDNMVFTFGVAYKMGVDAKTFHDCFTAVMNANMEKKKGVKAGREGFGNAADAIKPDNWQSPEDRIGEILLEKIEDRIGEILIEKIDNT